MRSVLVTCLVCVVLGQSPLSIPTREVAPGVQMPVVMIGTGKSHAYEVSNIINGWFDLGGNGVDTAYNYGDQPQIAAIIQNRGVNRNHLFLTSKIPGCPGKAAAQEYIDADLKQLNTSYLDLVLIHFPRGTNCASTWEALEESHAKGTLKAIGVSNFVRKDIENLLKTAKTIPAVNQIHYSVFSHDDDTIQVCKMHNITVQSYSPLNSKFDGGKSTFSNPTVLSIAKKHNVSAAQVALRWILHRGDILTFLSGNKTHMKNDADLFSFDLDNTDVEVINKIQNTTVFV